MFLKGPVTLSDSNVCAYVCVCVCTSLHMHTCAFANRCHQLQVAACKCHVFGAHTNSGGHSIPTLTLCCNQAPMQGTCTPMYLILGLGPVTCGIGRPSMHKLSKQMQRACSMHQSGDAKGCEAQRQPTCLQKASTANSVPRAGKPTQVYHFYRHKPNHRDRTFGTCALSCAGQRTTLQR
jgi:hypothetical protein